MWRQESWEREFSLSTMVVRVSDGWVQTISTIYGPNDSCLRPPFCNKIRHLRNINEGAWIITGDYDIIRFASERRGGDRNQ